LKTLFAARIFHLKINLLGGRLIIGAIERERAHVEWSALLVDGFSVVRRMETLSSSRTSWANSVEPIGVSTP